MTPETPEQSPVERIKSQSDYLRGRIAAELAEPTDRFSDDTSQLLKHHGIYQQDDRDRRQHLGLPGKPSESGRAYSFMVRTAITGGRLTSEQFLAELDLADEFGNGALRITSRQNLQLYGIAKRNLAAVLRRINDAGLSTLGAAGDLLRNVMCCPAPYCRDQVHGQIQGMAGYLSRELRPHTPAYKEIWLGNLPPAGPPGGQEVEPLYGRSYLPRKFKLAIGLPGDNCVDLYAQDLGLLALCENFQVVGYNVLVGGGMGVTTRREDTFPALARPMARIRPEQVVEVVRAVLSVFRDCGARLIAARARMKYLVADWGLEKFKAEVEARLGYALPQPQPVDVWDIDDHVGWHEQGDGRWFYGLHVDRGQIADTGDVRLKSALREICQRYHPRIALGPGHAVLFCDLPIEHRAGIEDLLRRHDVKLDDELSNVRRWARACAALPTCSQAITEGQRALPGVLEPLEAELVGLGLADELLTLRMSGCSNGCWRPYTADVGLVGRGAGRYAIHLGGHRLGDRLGFLFQDGVPLERVVPTLAPLLAYFKQDRRAGESFGDFCHRKGCRDLTERTAGDCAK